MAFTRRSALHLGMSIYLVTLVELFITPLHKKNPSMALKIAVVFNTSDKTAEVALLTFKKLKLSDTIDVPCRCLLIAILLIITLLVIFIKVWFVIVGR